MSFFFFHDTATTEIYTLSLHDALPIFQEGLLHLRELPPVAPQEPARLLHHVAAPQQLAIPPLPLRSEEHTSELQSLRHLVCRLLLEKKKKHQFTFYTLNTLESIHWIPS